MLDRRSSHRTTSSWSIPLHDAPFPIARVRARWQAEREITLPALGIGATDRGRAAGQRDVLCVHLVSRIPRRSSATTFRPADHECLQSAEARLRSVALRNQAGVLPEQRRHAGADVHHAPQGHGARRLAIPTYLYGYGGFNVSLTPAFSVEHCWRGSSWAACSRCPTCAAAAEYGEEWHEAGMLEQEAERVRRLHRGGGVPDRREDTRRRRSWRSEAGPTAACWWARDDSASGAVRRGAARRRGDGHAAVPQVHDRLGVGRPSTAQPTARPSSRTSTPTRRCTISGRARTIRPRSSRPPITTTAWCRGTRSSLPRRCRRRRAAPRPVLIRIETKAGHGAGKPTRKIIEEQADRWAFLENPGDEGP